MENIKAKKLTKYSLFILVLLFAVFSCGKKEEEKSKANVETKINEKNSTYKGTKFLDYFIIAFKSTSALSCAEAWTNAKLCNCILLATQTDGNV